MYVVNEQMAKVNTDFLGISEIKWTRIGEFSSDVRYINYCGKESLRRKVVALTINKRVQNAVLRCNLKNDNMIHFVSKSTIQHHSNSSLYPNTDAEEAEANQLYENLLGLR